MSGPFIHLLRLRSGAWTLVTVPDEQHVTFRVRNVPRELVQEQRRPGVTVSIPEPMIRRVTSF